MLITLVTAAAFGIVYAFASRFQAATLWAGRTLAPSGSEALMPNGIQDGLTPPWLTRLNFVWMLGFLGVLITGSVQRWYLGVLAVVLAIAVSSLAQRMFPKDLATYLRLIANNLANREADYRRFGDTLRADAAHDFFLKVSRLLEEIVGSERRVPSMREARAAPFGQLGD